MKKKQKVQIFKLEERVLFDGAAAAEIVAAVNQAGDQNQANDQPDESAQDKEEKIIQNTVQNAGPVDTPAPEANVQNAGEGLPQADAAQNDPAEVLINGNADFSQVTDPGAEFSGDVAEFIQAAAEPDAASHELIVIDSDAADQFDADAFEGKNVLFLDSDSDAADQIDDWMNEHSDQDIQEVRLVTDSDTLASQIGDIEADVVSVADFQAELSDAGSSDLIIVPDHSVNLSVDAFADELPENLTQDAAADRRELVILNSSTVDIDNVLEQLGDSRDILVLNSFEDGFGQISDFLDGSSVKYDAVHILTHGNEDGVVLGDRLITRTSSFSVFQGHLNPGADMLLYGCNMASSEHGVNFIQAIADVTGADVAASVDITGSIAHGGNWILEYSSGKIDTASISLDSSWDFALEVIKVGAGQTYDGLAKVYAAYGAYGLRGDTLAYVSGGPDDSMGENDFEVPQGLIITLYDGSDVSIKDRDSLSIIAKIKPYNNNGSLTVIGLDPVQDTEGNIHNGNIILKPLDGSELPDISLGFHGYMEISAGTVNQTGIIQIAGSHSKLTVTGTGILNSNNRIEIVESETEFSDVSFSVSSGGKWNVSSTFSLENYTLSVGSEGTLSLNNGSIYGQVSVGAGGILNVESGINNRIRILDFNGASGTWASDTKIQGDTFNISNIETEEGFVWSNEIGFKKVNIDKANVTFNKSPVASYDSTDGKYYGSDITISSGSTVTIACDDFSLSGTDYTGTLTVKKDAVFNLPYGKKFTGNIDNYASNITFDADHTVEVIGELRMRDGTTFDMQTDASITTLYMDQGSTFNYAEGVTLQGSFTNAAQDLTFEAGQEPVRFTGTLTMIGTTLTLNASEVSFAGLVFGEGAKLINTADVILKTDMLKSEVDLNWGYSIDPETGTETYYNTSLTIKPYTDGGTVKIDLDSKTMSAYDLSLNASEVRNATLKIRDGGSFSVDSKTRNYGAIEFGKGVTFKVYNDIVLGKVSLSEGSRLEYEPGITMTGSLDIQQGSYIYAKGTASPEPSQLTLTDATNFTISNIDPDSGDVLSGLGVLTMESGTTLNLETDVNIVKIELKEGANFSTQAVTINGSLDYSVPGGTITIDDTFNLSITGSLTMQNGTTLDLQTNNVNISNLFLTKGSTFKYKDGLTRSGTFSSEADLVFDKDITFKDGILSLGSDKGIEVRPGVTLNLENEEIIIKEGAGTANAIINAGTVNFSKVNTIEFNNEQSSAYAAILNTTITITDETGTKTGTGTVSIKDASLSIDFSSGTSALVRNGILNNGQHYNNEGTLVKAALNMDNGVLEVLTGNNRSQTGYAINNTLGEVSIVNGSKVSLNTYGSESSAVINARGQTVIIGQPFKEAGKFDGSLISVNGNKSAYMLAAVSNDGELYLYNSNLVAGNGLPILRDSDGNLYLYKGKLEGATNTNPYMWELNGQVILYTKSQTPGEKAQLYLSSTSETGSGRTVLAVEDSSVGLLNATTGNASFIVDVTNEGQSGSAQYAEYAEYLGNKLELNRWNDMTDAEIMVDFSKTVFSITNEGSTYIDGTGETAKTVSLKGHSVINQNMFRASADVMTFSFDGINLDFESAPVAALNGSVKQVSKASSPDTNAIRLENITINGDLHLIGNADFSRENLYLNGNLINEGNNVRLTGKFMNSPAFTIIRENVSSVGVETVSYTGHYSDGITVVNREYAPASYGNIHFGDPEKKDSIEFSPELNYSFFNYAGEMDIYNFTGLGIDYYHPLVVYNSGIFKIDNNLFSDTAMDMYVKGFNPYDIIRNGHAFSDTVSTETVNSDQIVWKFFDSDQSSQSAVGINDLGIVNFNSYSYGQFYPVPNDMTITDLNLMNAQSAAAAVTNVAGTLTIVRGSLQGSYSGIDLLVKVDTHGKSWTIITPITELTDLTKIAGGAASIRNSGKLTLNGANVPGGGGTLLTNDMDFGENYGEYVAFANYSFTVYLNEVSGKYYLGNSFDENDLRVYGYSGIQFYNEQFALSKYNSSSSLTPSEFSLYYVSSAALNDRSTVTIDNCFNDYNQTRIALRDYDYASGSYSTSDYTIQEWNYGNYFGKDSLGEHLLSGYSLVSNVAFKSKQTAYNTMAMRNWGELVIQGINGGDDYRFSGFTVAVDNGYNTYWANEYASVYGTVPVDYYMTYNNIRYHYKIPYLPLGALENPDGDNGYIRTFTMSADISLSFSVSASSVKTSDLVTKIKTYAREGSEDLPAGDLTVVTRSYGELVLRGEETAAGSGSYSGSLEAEGANYAVYKRQTLTLINFSVDAFDTTSAIENYGVLNIFNGTEISETKQVTKTVTVPVSETESVTETVTETVDWTYYIGASNASISATGGSAIINHGTLTMFNGAVTNSHIGIEQLFGAQSLVVVNSTFYNNDIGIVSDAGSTTSQVVVDTTIVSANYGSIGIQLTRAAGQLDLVNSVILVRGGYGLVNDVAANVNGHYSGNIIGSPENTGDLMVSVYGTDFENIGTMWDSGKNVLKLKENSSAMSGGIAVGYTVNDNTYKFVFGSASAEAINITWDKAGNDRTAQVGSYVLSGSVGPTPTVTIQVTTLKDSDGIIISGESKLYSLRYVINYLLSDKNTGADTEVVFDWEKLYGEAGSKTLNIALDKTLGSLNVSNASGTSPIQELAIDLSVSDHEIPSGYTLNIDGSKLTDSVFKVSGIALSVKGAGALTVTGSGNTTANGAAFNLADVAGTSLLLNNTTVTGGNTMGNGGAVYVGGANASLSATGSVFTGNTAANGGAIYNNGGTVSVNSIMSGNTATVSGGGIYNLGTAVIIGNISGNVAVDGAGIYSGAGSLEMTGYLYGNTASGEGAGAYIAGGYFNMLGDITGNSGDSILHVAGGLVQLGDLDHFIYITGNTGTLVQSTAGDVLIVNASISGNDSGSSGDSLFEISDSVFTLLNSTVTGNTGDILDQNGGTVQIADSTIAYGSGNITVSGGNLYALNSIVDAANTVTVTNQAGSLINVVESDVFESGVPSGRNGTLVIKRFGPAGLGGVVIGYTHDSNGTHVYYTTDGDNWQDVNGAAVAVAGLTTVSMSQNETVRLFHGYSLLNIGAYSVNLSLVVTSSNDTSTPGLTTLREALESADFLFKNTGEIQTVTFNVDNVELGSTVTINSPVAVAGKGNVTVKAANSFAGDSVFVVNSSGNVEFSGLSIEGKIGSPASKGARGIRVDGGHLDLSSVSISNSYADPAYDPNSKGGAIYVQNGSLTGRDVTLSGNYARTGAAIYSNGPVDLDGFTISGNTQTGNNGGVVHVTDASSVLKLYNGVFTGNDTAGTLIQTAGSAELISVTVANNGWNDYFGSALLMADSADIVNSTLTGNAANDAALVYITNDLNVANSIIVTSHDSGPAALAGSIKSAYSIYSGFLENVAVDVGNQTGSTFNELFYGSKDGRPVVKEGSAASIGVWTMYDPASRTIAYSVRPEDIWTEGYKPQNMQWRYLGGGAASYNPVLLVGNANQMPSTGSFWDPSGRNHPDYGPGVNNTQINPTYNGGFGSDWGYSSVVNGYFSDPASRLSGETESGMSWYAAMLSELFGFRTPQSSILSVSGGIPADELGLSVDAEAEDFGEFQEAPYRADDGTPLSQEELNAIRNAAVSGRLPADSVHLDEAVHEKVAASLRSSELFKDSFDKALDALLGLDA